ncbi:unnamed protein product [Paramecium primaurelia]|uniref:Uncharacterized protein n=1 Tax=Paramecium primaurelia TaxID=5886 RepID=A0A8S1LSL8_PARPR|nr:unnamed protein product [Paramecium primaurelia]
MNFDKSLKNRPTLSFTGFSPSKSNINIEASRKNLQSSSFGSPHHAQSLEAQLKQEFEAQYNERILTMRSFYDMKYQTLFETVKEALDKIMNDELIDTMRQDITSQEFVYQRVREMFEEIILSEREVLIEKLSSQYAYLKMEFGKIEQDKRKLAIELQIIQDEQADKEAQAQNQVQQAQEQISYLQQNNDQLNNKVSQLEQKLSSANQTAKEVQQLQTTAKEYNILKEEYEQLVQTNEKLQLINKQQVQEIEQLHKISENLQLKVQQLNKIYQELEGEVISYKKKSSDSESKTQFTISNLQNQLEAVTLQFTQQKSEYEKRLEKEAQTYQNEINKLSQKLQKKKEKSTFHKQNAKQLQIRLDQLIRDHAEQLQNETQQFQRKINELQQQNQFQLQQAQKSLDDLKESHDKNIYNLRNQFEQINKQQCDDSDKQKINLLNELDRVQSELESVVLQQQQQIESNYIPKIQYEQQVNELQKKIIETNQKLREQDALMKKQQDEFENYKEQWNRQQNKLHLDVKDRNEIQEQLLAREETINNQNKQISQLTQQVKMLESDYQRLQERSKQQLEYIEELKNDVNNRQSEVLKIQKQLKQQKDELMEQYRQLEGENKSKNDKVQLLNSQLEKLLYESSENEKLLNYKSKELQQLEDELIQYQNFKRNAQQLSEENEQLRIQIDKLINIQELQEQKQEEIKRQLDTEQKQKNQLILNNESLMQRHQKYVKTIKEQRKYIKRRIVSELQKIKQEHSSLEQYLRQIMRMKNNEDNLLIASIVTKVKDLWNRKEIQHENEILKIRNEIFDQYSGSASHLRTAYEQTLDETQKQFEQQIENLRDAKEKMEDENKELLHELQKVQVILEDQSALITNLKNENKTLKSNGMLIENELSTTLKNMNDMKDSFEDQIQELTKQLKKYERKQQHQQDLKGQIDILQNELDKLRTLNRSNTQETENRIAKLVKQQQSEVQLLINQFQREQIKLRQEQTDLKDQLSQNEEIIHKLYQSLDDVNSIVNQKDKQLQNLIEDIEQERASDQQKITDLQNKLRREEDEMKVTRQKSQRDIEKIQLQIASAESEISQFKIENKQLRIQCEQLAEELEKKTKQFDQLNREYEDQKIIQNQEIADLHKLLKIQVQNDDMSNYYSESKELAQRVKELQKINSQFSDTNYPRRQESSVQKFDSSKKLNSSNNLKPRLANYTPMTKK